MFIIKKFSLFGFSEINKKIELFRSINEFIKKVHPNDIDGLNIAVNQHIQGNTEIFIFDFRLYVNDKWVWHRLKGKAIARDAAGKAIYLVGSSKNIDEQYSQIVRLDELAKYDSLTGLLNRRTFFNQFNLDISENNKCKFCLLFIDLDGFKLLNDSLGHSKGDEYLQNVAQTLKNELPKDARICRYGGDEFIAAFSHENDWLKIVQRLIDVKTPFEYPSRVGSVKVTGSIGVSLYPDHGTSVDTLIDYADKAMYHAKESGRDRFAVYSFEMAEKAKMKIGMIGELREALEKNTLNFHLQPKFNSDKTITGAELLCRWSSLTYGNVSPAVFIPLIEEYDLSEILAFRAIEHAVKYQSKLKEVGVNILLAVNISAKQVLSDKFLEFCLGIFSDYKICTNCVELEVTESLFINDGEKAEKSLEKFRNAGFRVAMDDFGTGYSSLSYVSRYHFDTIKIDQSFVKDMLNNQKAKLLVDGIVSICHTLGMKIVAEGVETLEQFEALKKIGVHRFQGFFLSKPIPFNGLIEKIKEKNKLEIINI